MKEKAIFCIIDDDSVYQFILKKAIKDLDVAEKIMSFFDGEEALNFIIENFKNAEELPDFILLDIDMPIMDGFQFIEEYIKIKQKINKNITIYMVSSSVDSADIERAKNIKEITDYLSKPIEHKLEAILSNY